MGKTRLSELQLAVVNVLWQRGTATVADVRDALPDRDLATTTVATILKRLHDAGAVARKKDGRMYVYRAAISQQDVRRSMVGDLVDWLFGGNSEALVSHLVHESDIAPADLDRLRERIRRSESPPDRPGGSSEASSSAPSTDASPSDA